MTSSYPPTVFAYHGCDRDVAERILASDSEHLTPSRNIYDWLGDGIYFWENAPERALAWARQKANEKAARGEKFAPAVIGAVVNLGRCLNVMDKTSNQVLRDEYSRVQTIWNRAGTGKPLPTNKSKLHYLDRLVVNFVLHLNESNGQPYDTVRAAFIEGTPVYSGSSFMDDTHIQLCVRNPEMILAYFRPRI